MSVSTTGVGVSGVARASGWRVESEEVYSFDSYVGLESDWKC